MATALFPLQRDILLSYYSNLNSYDIQSARLMRESSLSDTVEDKSLVNTPTDITSKYIKKINDASSVLESIDADTQRIADFFDSVKNGSLVNFKESIPLKDINEIGKLKPEYLRQAIQDTGKTIDDIMNKRKTMKDLMMYVKSNPATKIKRQLVSSSNPIIDVMDYVKQQERIPLTDITIDVLSKEGIPFLRSFTTIKHNLYDESMNVKTTIGHAAAMIHKYSDTAESIKARGDLDGPTVDCLNYYLYNQYRVIEELISYLTFSLVIKIDNYVFNVNAYNDLYRRYKSLMGNNYPMNESTYEYSMAGIDIDNLSKRASNGDMSGVIDWTMRAYDAVLSSFNQKNTGYTTIQFILDRFTNPNFVFDTVNHFMDQIIINIDNVKPALRSTYINPSSLLSDVGLLDMEGVINEAKKISDISFYENKVQNGNSAYSDILFTIMAEMRQSPDKCEKLAEMIKKTYDKLEEFYKYITDGSDIPNPTARYEMKQLFEGVMDQFDVFTKELVENIIERYQNLEKLCYKLMGMQNDVIECSDVVEYGRDYNVFSFESCIDLDKELAITVIESEMRIFKEIKLAKDYGLYAEDTSDQNNTQNSNNQNSQENSNDNGKPGEVKTDPNAQNDAAKEQNTKASNETKDNKNDEKKKEDDKGFFKRILESISKFFDNVINSFTKSISVRFTKDSEFIKKHKDELLSRNYTGVTINMYNYDFGMTGQNMRDDITKVSQVLSQVNETNVHEYKGDENNKNVIRERLFKDIPLNTSITDVKTALQLYYKVGSKSTEVKKTKYDTADSVSKLVKQMVSFCENFCINGEYKQMQNDLDKLKKSLIMKIKSLEGKFPEEKKQDCGDGIAEVDKNVLVFAGAVLTGYKNRFQHYMYILRRCVVKKEETENSEPNEQNDSDGEGTQDNKGNNQ